MRLSPNVESVNGGYHFFYLSNYTSLLVELVITGQRKIHVWYNIHLSAGSC